MLLVLSLNAGIKHRQKAWFRYLKTQQRKYTPAGRSGNTVIQNSTELLVSLPFYFPSHMLQPELKVAGNVEVCDVYRDRSGEAL